MRVKPRKQRFQNYIPFESVIFLGREIQYETICPVDLDMFLSIITMMMMMIITVPLYKGHFFFFGGVGVGVGGTDSPHVHSCSMATFFCPKVAVVKWFNCTSIIYYMTYEKH